MAGIVFGFGVRLSFGERRMDYDEYLEEEYQRKDARDRLIHPVSYPVRCHIRRCRWTFPNQHYPVLFHRLERIRKRKLSLSERDQVKAICNELIDNKEYVETAEELRQQLKSEARHEKWQISVLKKANSSAEQLLEYFEYLGRTTIARRRISEKFRSRLYESIDRKYSRAEITEVLRSIVKNSKDVIEEESQSKAKRGPLPDAALRKCISELAQVFGEEKATAGWSDTKGRRTTPFIDFVQAILFALPENAMIGRNGPYTWAAIEEHVHAVCKDLKKALPARIKKQRLAG